MTKLMDYAQLLARLLLGQIFVIAGAGKIGSYGGVQGYMESAGVPAALLPAVIALELLAGLLIIIGYRTRLAALALAGFCIAAGLLFHLNFADESLMNKFMRDLAMAGGLLLLFVHGPGRLAVRKDG